MNGSMIIKYMSAIMLMFMIFVPAAYAAPQTGEGASAGQDIIQQQLDNLDLSQLAEFYRNFAYGEQRDMNAVLKDMLTGRTSFNIWSLIKGFISAALKEVVSNVSLIVKVLLIAIVTAILNQLQSSFDSKSVGEIAFYACYVLIMIIVIQSFNQMMSYGRDALSNMVLFMQAFAPTMYTLLMASGAVSSSAMFQPLVALLVGMTGTFVKDVVLPLLFFSAILTLVNYISDKVPVERLAGLLKNVASWTLKLTFVIFSAVVIVQGVAAGSFDSVSFRAAKFAVDNFIPVVGRALSDSMATIASYTALVKNAVGLIGLIILASICVVPAVKIVAVAFIYKLASAVIEPIVEPRIARCLNSIGDILIMLFTVIFSVAVIFFIAIALVIGISSPRIVL